MKVIISTSIPTRTLLSSGVQARQPHHNYNTSTPTRKHRLTNQTGLIQKNLPRTNIHRMVVQDDPVTFYTRQWLLSLV